jgi:hypothetical protein
MPWYKVNGMLVHLKLGGKAAKNPPAPCAARIPNGPPIVGSTMRCCGISHFLCDWPMASGGTCDMPLCTEHAEQTGPDRHLCPKHAAQRLEEQPELF